MAYGTSTYSASAYGGSANAVNEQIFFPLLNRDPDVLYEATGLFNGSEEWYEILTHQGSEPGSGPTGIEYKVYTSPQEGITPQLQATIGGSGQTIITPAAIVIVTAIIDSEVWAFGNDFSVRGRPYTQ
jgi:hypothetical protein